MEYKQHIFYRTNHLSVEEKKKLLYEAKEKSYDWHVDKLDCNESYARKPIKMGFDEVIEKLTSDSHFIFIHRRGFITNSEFHRWKVETGFSTLSSPDYYLFVYMEENELNYFVNNYRLEIM